MKRKKRREIVKVATASLAQTLRAYADNTIQENANVLWRRDYCHENQDHFDYVLEFSGDAESRAAYRAGIRRAAELLDGWSKI